MTQKTDIITNLIKSLKLKANASAGEEVKQLEPSSTADRNAKQHKHFRK